MLWKGKKDEEEDKESVDVWRTGLDKLREVTDEAKRNNLLQKLLQYLVGSLSVNNEAVCRGPLQLLHQRYILQ